MAENKAIYAFDRAIVRRPSRSAVRGIRATDRGDPDYDGLKAEHDAYVAALKSAGVEVAELAPLEAFPDSIFVEDPALVFPEGVVVLRSAAPSRAGEAAELKPVLKENFETVLALPALGFADGGDILATPCAVMIGLSARTDRPGAEGVKTRLAEFGYRAKIVETPAGVLHFKTACSLVDEETVLLTKPMALSGVFDGFEKLITPEGEEAAANALRINDNVFVGAQFPKTIELLDRHGFTVVPLPTIEIGKIDAGLSCMSLRWRTLA